MKKRKLGNLEVSALGFGCMGRVAQPLKHASCTSKTVGAPSLRFLQGRA
jgi:aryl-alcohol dehydrogenase-like predicted oxidoreductase